MKIRPGKKKKLTKEELTSQLGTGYYVGSKLTHVVMNKRLRTYESHVFELRLKT